MARATRAPRAGGGHGERAPRARWPSWGVLLSLLVTWACGGPPERPPDVVLVTLDTFRADHVGTYGARGVSTPALDAFAEESLLFENASAPMPMTVPSHLSVLTGRYPREHGALNNAMALLDDEVSVAERFRDHAYATAAFVAMSLLSERSGSARGFDTFSTADRKRKQRPASEVVPEALGWLATVPEDRPFFLWVHLFDTHLPYAPEPPWNAAAMEASGGRWPRLHWPDFQQAANDRDGDVPAELLEHAKRLYAAEVELTDHWVGRLLDGLRARGGWREATVVVTADHGECFENGIYFEHADCLFQGAIRVPLLVALPGRPRAGDRVAAQASLVDVAPTLLAAAGLPPLDGAAGLDLARLEADDEARAVLIQHPVYGPAEARRRAARQRVIRSVAGTPTRTILAGEAQIGVATPGWKYLRSRGEERLYRLDAPDGEETDLAGRESAVARRLRARLRELLDRHPVRAPDPGEIPEGLRDTLEALGYL